MFLGGLSASTERQARQKKNKKESHADSDEERGEPAVPLRRAGELPVLYTSKEGEGVPRPVLLSFLSTCVDMLLDDAHLRAIVANSKKKNVGLHISAIDFQRDVLEHNFQIERNYGCRHLSLLGQHFPDDEEVVGAAKKFMFTCMKSYIKALKIRSKMYKSGAFPGPAPNQSMTRNCILEFFEGCNALMAMPETKEELRSIFLSKGTFPNERVIEMQRNVLKLIGYNPDFAVSCLNRIPSDFGQDREIMMKMQQFALCAETACKEASFNDEEKAEFYKAIPPLMHHFPHMHIMQQRMMQQQMMMQQQQQVMQSGDRAKEIEALKQSGILNLISAPEGRQKLTGLVERISKARETVEGQFKSCSEDEKKSFFSEFRENELVGNVQSSLEDSSPLSKISVFLEVSDAALESAVRFQMVVNEDSGLLKQIREPEQGEDDVSKSLNIIFTTLTSLSSANMRMMGQQGGQHVHSPGCHLHGGRMGQPDVSMGKSDKMDR